MLRMRYTLPIDNHATRTTAHASSYLYQIGVGRLFVRESNTERLGSTISHVNAFYDGIGFPDWFDSLDDVFGFEGMEHE